MMSTKKKEGGKDLSSTKVSGWSPADPFTIEEATEIFSKENIEFDPNRLGFLNSCSKEFPNL